MTHRQIIANILYS